MEQQFVQRCEIKVGADVCKASYVVLTIFTTQNIYHHVWKIVRTTLQCIVGLQSRGEGHEMEKNCGTNRSPGFLCFSNLLPGMGEQGNIKVLF